MYPAAVIMKSVGKFSKLDSRNAWNYFKAGRKRGYIVTEILDPFDEALKCETGWSDEKIPRETKTDACKLKDVTFTITTKPTIKRPGYSEIYDNLIVYLNFVLEECKKGATSEGVKIFEDMPYVLLNSLKDRVDAKGEEIIKEGVEQKIGYEESERIKDWFKGEKPPALLIPTKRKPNEINEGNSLLYVRADKLSSYLKDEVIAPFESALKTLTSWSGEKAPNEAEEFWEQMGPHIFHIKSIPYESTKYADVINRLVKEDKDLKKSGDWIKILGDFEDKSTRKYSVKTHSGEKYVSALGTLDAIQKIKREKTKLLVRQPISYYPMVND